jgi:hypothetical protein
MSELDAILNGEEIPAEAPQEEVAQVEEVQEEVKAEEAPQAEPEITEPVETTATEEAKEKDSWQYAAYKDEKQKRQDLERRLAELEAEKQPVQELPDVLDDQQGFVNSMRAEMQQMNMQNRMEISRSMMMDAKPDYEAKEAAFIELARENPMLADQARNHPNPARFAYEQATKAEQFAQMQDVDSYKAKIEAEIRAKLESEFKAKQEQEVAKTQSITPSLANAPAADSDAHVPDTLESLLGR